MSLRILILPKFYWTLFCPMRQHVRHHKINIKRPDPGPWERRVLLEITKPIVYNELAKDSVRCSIERQKEQSTMQEENAYEEFLIRQCKRMFNEMRMILAYQLLPMDNEVIRLICNQLRKKGLELVHFNNNIMRRAVVDTKYRNITPLFNGTSRYVVSPEPNISDAIKVTRRAPGLILMGGLVEDALLSHDAVLLRSKISDLATSRASLLSVLNTPASKITSQLISQHNRLSGNLTQYIAQSNEDT